MVDWYPHSKISTPDSLTIFLRSEGGQTRKVLLRRKDILRLHKWLTEWILKYGKDAQELQKRKQTTLTSKKPPVHRNLKKKGKTIKMQEYLLGDKNGS